MKVAMTLIARDEADIVDAWLAFHLNAGVDVVVALDHASEDGTADVLESYARDGHVHLLTEPAKTFDQPAFLTRLARLAAASLGADWVVHADADEFWWPRGGSLKDVLAAVPEPYGIVRGLIQHFLVRPDDGSFFADRMDVRLVNAPIQSPTSRVRPAHKVAHRADPLANVGIGAHGVEGPTLVPLQAWTPCEVLHFPVRSVEQCRRKYVNRREHWGAGGSGPGPIVEGAYRAIEERGAQAFYDSLAVSDTELARGLGAGAFVRDVRLRDALARLRTPAPRSVLVAPPRPEDGALFAHELATLDATEATRLFRRLDELERRTAALDRHSQSGRLRSSARG